MSEYIKNFNLLIASGFLYKSLLLLVEKSWLVGRGILVALSNFAHLNKIGFALLKWPEQVIFRWYCKNNTISRHQRAILWDQVGHVLCWWHNFLSSRLVGLGWLSLSSASISGIFGHNPNDLKDSWGNRIH